jgi:hypothetical protein
MGIYMPLLANRIPIKGDSWGIAGSELKFIGWYRGINPGSRRHQKIAV